MNGQSAVTSGQPLVSIVTPAFNQAAFLPETIESVLAQDYPRIEYIVIDDGSSDNTGEVLKCYSGRAKVFSQSNIGQARTLNKGWSMTSGKYIGYLSSDDILYPNAISSLVDSLEKHPQAVAAFPDADHLDRDSRVIRRNVCRPFDYDHLVVSQECFIGPGALFRRSAYDQVGGWRPELRRTPDREFWMRLGMLGPILMVAKSLAGYRMHSDSTSFRENNPDAAMEYVRVTSDFFADGRIPESLKRRQAEAMGFAYLMVARSCFRATHFRQGLRAFRTACDYNPAIRTPRIVWHLARSLLGRPLKRLVWHVRSAMS